MENPVRYILSRTIAVVLLLVALMYGFSYINKHQRKSAVVAELRQISGESFFFRQFSAEDARKTLIRAIGLLAEAESLGMDIDKAIDRGLGIKAVLFENEYAKDNTTPVQQIIRGTLRGNYDNFIKLGYQPEFSTFDTMKHGELPLIPAGPFAGRKPVIRTLIPESASPGMDKVIANLELSPPGSEDMPLTDIQSAAAKQLARNLSHAQVIDGSVSERIITWLETPEEPEKK